MKLRGISIKVIPIDNDDFRGTWTFVIDGMHFRYSVGQMHGSFEKAQRRAEEIVHQLISQGE